MYDNVLPDIVLAGGSVVFSVVKALGNVPVGNFEPSDVDVFVRHSAFAALHERLLTENVWRLVEKDFNAPARDILHGRLRVVSDEYYLRDYGGLASTIAAVAFYAPTPYLASKVHSFDTVTAECCKLQVIVLDDDIVNPLEHIARFDLSCCKSFFDGKNLQVMGIAPCFSPSSAVHGSTSLSVHHAMWMSAVFLVYDEHCKARTLKKNWKSHIPLAAMIVPTPKPVFMLDFYYTALRKLRLLSGNPPGFLGHLGKTLAVLQRIRVWNSNMHILFWQLRNSSSEGTRQFLTFTSSRPSYRVA